MGKRKNKGLDFSNKIFSSLLSKQIVSVQPLPKPTNNLFYIDYKYESKSERIRKERLEKLNELFNDDLKNYEN